MINSTIDIMDKGFACLVEKLGVVNAERFIAMVKRENFDYTIWRREYFDNMSLEEINNEARRAPAQGKRHQDLKKAA